MTQKQNKTDGCSGDCGIKTNQENHFLLTRAYRHSSWHRQIIDISMWCGCFYCISWFVSDNIEKWIDHGETAMCPHCGIDAVIPDKSGFLPEDLSERLSFLIKMNKWWFT